MRFTIMSFVLLLGLMLGATAMAGHHESDEGAAKEMPPIEASPPADTEISTPAAPAAPAAPEDKAPAEGAATDDEQ